jgi:hypothetical protein
MKLATIKMNTQPKNQRAELAAYRDTITKGKAESRKNRVEAFRRRYASKFRRMTFGYND